MQTYSLLDPVVIRHHNGETTALNFSRCAATALADLFAKHETTPFSGYYGENRKSRLELYPDVKKSAPIFEDIHEFETISELVLATDGLDDGWKCAVGQIQTERSAAAYAAKRRATYEAQTNPAVRAFLLAEFDGGNGRAMREASPRDLSDLRTLAVRDDRRPVKYSDGQTRRIGKAPYAPKAGCSSKLRLKDAVHFAAEEAAYADHSRYVVPVTIAPGSDLKVCRENLWSFVSSLCTANGLAGSGSTWSAELHVLPEGAVVVLDCRSSIAD